MKRDMDVVRAVLLAFEASEESVDRIDDLPIAGYDKSVIWHHAVILADKGYLVDVHREARMSGDDYVLLVHEGTEYRLSWEGHEYLDAVRDPKVWAKTKEGAKKVGSSSVDVLWAIARELIKSNLRRHTGIRADL